MAISFAVVAMAMLTVVLIDYNPHYDYPKEEVDFCMHYARYKQADSIAFSIASKDSLNWENQEYLLNIHFQIPEVCEYVVEPRSKRRRAKIKYLYRDDQRILNYFKTQSLSSHRPLKAQGSLGLASCYLRLSQLDSAHYYLSQVGNPNLPGYHANRGVYHLKKEQTDSAVYFFQQEISLNGASKMAYRNLAAHYIRKGKQEELDNLLKDPAAFELLSTTQQKYIHFKKLNIPAYWFTVLAATFSHWNIFSFIGAFLIAFFWVFYLYKIDLYEPEKKRYVFLCFLMGCCTVLPTEMLSDMNHYWFDQYLNGQTGHDFMYSVFGIGLIEEFSKTIPFLIMVYILKQANEPYDYIKYACLSAIGFAFVENILYIDSYGLNILHGRMTLAAFGHIFFSSIVGYVLALNHYRWKMPWLLALALGLLIASFAHGFYDFWFINRAANGFAIFSYVLIMLAIFIFHGFINSALNNSDFFDRNKKFDNVYYSTLLITGSSFVYAYEYMSSFLLYGFDYGLDNVYKMISYSVCIYAALFLVVINRVIIVPKNWLSVFHLFYHPKNRLDGELKKGVHCRLKKFSANFYQERMLPASGEIVDITNEKERKYYLVRLLEPSSIDLPVKDHLVFRLKEKMDTGDNLAALYLLPEQALLSSRKFANKKMIFCGWVKLEIEDPV